MSHPIFVISLPGSKRRGTISSQMNRLGLAFEFFDGFDGRGLTGPALKAICNTQASEQLLLRKLAGGEVGCSRSHLLLYEEIVRRRLPWALVLEDDAGLHDDLPDLLQDFVGGGLSRRVDVLSLFSQQDSIRVLRRGVLESGRIHAYRVMDPNCYNAVGYLITQRGAARVTRHFQRWQRKSLTVADWPLAPAEWRFYLQDPQGVDHNDGGVTMTTDRVASTIPSHTIGHRLMSVLTRFTGIDFLLHRDVYPSFLAYWHLQIVRRCRIKLGVLRARGSRGIAIKHHYGAGSGEA